MRILAIRGRNLASLAGDFELDFRREPLASAGLYAIAGPTGSGKSTLLDALCLALYQNTPRLERAGRRGGIPDGSDSLTPGDPRTLLRRGCSEGHAEVDFIGIDGTGWRARWAVRRARGRDLGKLQKADLSLRRLADGQAWADHKTDFSVRIRELTGLDFTQFCRSVLLAQGEFAALLKAKADERGQLLEALTGTGIFQQLSKAAHERARQARSEEDALQQALGQQAPLADDARAALEAERAQLLRALADARIERTRLEAAARWHAEGREQAQRRAALAAEQAAIEARLAALDVDALDTAARDRALAAPLAALDAAEARLVQAETRRQAAEAAVAASAAELARQDAQLLEAEARTRARREQQRAAEPALQAARAADAERARITRELRALEAPRHDLGAQRAAVDAALEALTRQQAGLGAAEAAFAVWLAAHPAWADPALDWTAREARLLDLDGLRRQLQALEQQQAAIETALAETEAATTKARSAETAARSATEQAKADREAARQACASHPPAEALDAERDGLNERQQQLEALQTAIAAAERAGSAFDAARTACDAAAAAHGQAADEHALAVSALAQAETDAAALRRSHELLRLRHDAHTVLLRQSLIDGEPCPVCGARSHPGGQVEADADRLLASLAETLQQAETTLHQSRARREAAAVALARSELVLAQAEADRAHHAASADQTQRRLAEAAAGLGLGPQPTPADLAPRVAALAEARGNLQARIEARAADIRRLEQARVAEEQAQASLQQASRTREQAEARQLGPREQRARLLGERDGLRERQQRLLAALSAEGLDGLDPAALARHHEGQARKTRAEAEQRTRVELDARRERLDLQQTALGERLAELAARTAAFEEAHATALAARRAALDAIDVEAHAAMLEQTVQEAAAAEASARSARDTARSTLDHERSRLSAAEVERAAAATAVAGLAEALDTQLAARAPGSDSLTARAALRDRLAALPPTLDADLAALGEGRERLGRLRIELEALQIAWQRREAAALSPDSAETVDAALAELTARMDSQQSRLGALGHQIDEDDGRRARNSEQAAALATLKAANHRWHQLADLIGAHDGQVFRQYAQQFTLEVLIEHANAHLQELAPRYRLSTGNEPLGLLMIDTDFGDERRSVHSLSGGESFLVSLALALGLASLSAERIRVESLFIDEGFGSLDSETLQVALNALDRLQAQGRRIGVISHVPDMADRIGVQVRVRPRGPGRSTVEVMG